MENGEWKMENGKWKMEEIMMEALAGELALFPAEAVSPS
jgi:hypothetical protein